VCTCTDAAEAHAAAAVRGHSEQSGKIDLCYETAKKDLVRPPRPLSVFFGIFLAFIFWSFFFPSCSMAMAARSGCVVVLAVVLAALVSPAQGAAAGPDEEVFEGQRNCAITGQLPEEVCAKQPPRRWVVWVVWAVRPLLMAARCSCGFDG
jgi:hypothetical protein